MEGQQAKAKEKDLQDLVSLRSRLIEQINESSKLLEELNSAIRALAPNWGQSASPVPSVSNGNTGTVSTGIEKLDQLLQGGYPISSNVMLNGPPFSSKELFAISFIRASLNSSLPTIVVAVDREPQGIKSMLGEESRLESLQEAGFLRIVDAYSRIVQTEATDPRTIIVDGTSNISSFLKSLDSIGAATLKEMGRYNIVVFSLTGLLTQTDEKVFIKTLQHFSQRRKVEGSTCLYLMEDGLFERRIYENANYFMDASIEFKNESVSEFLRVRGLSGVRTREWVEILQTKGTIDLGSFDLKRVR